jgi:hypothetical protein
MSTSNQRENKAQEDKVTCSVLWKQCNCDPKGD